MTVTTVTVTSSCYQHHKFHPIINPILMMTSIPTTKPMSCPTTTLVITWIAPACTSIIHCPKPGFSPQLFQLQTETRPSLEEAGFEAALWVKGKRQSTGVADLGWKWAENLMRASKGPAHIARDWPGIQPCWGGGRWRHRVWLGWGRGGQRVWLGWGWGEGGICPSPVSRSDTSFITGRKEAISVGGGGVEAAAAQGSGPACPPPPPAHSGSQRDDGKSRWRGLLAPAGEGHPLRCSRVYACHAHVYTLYVPHIPGHTMWTPPPMLIYTLANIHLLPLEYAAGTRPLPTHQW